MESATTLLEGCISTVSQCGICTKKKQLKIGVLIVSFILGTVDMVTDWINWNQWRSVGGYDQFHFIFIFRTVFLCAATAGTFLWTIEVVLMIHRSCGLFQKHLIRSKAEPTLNEENTNKSKCSSLSERMGLIVRLLIGLMEDFPVVIVLYYSVALPLCGVPTKREGSSATMIATIVSSMLNSIWTMFLLFWELCGCTKKLSNAQCCCMMMKSVYKPKTLLTICYCGWCGCATNPNCGCICFGHCKVKAETSRESRGNMKTCKCIGRIILCLMIFALFMGNFVLSTMTLGVAFQYPTVERFVGPLTKSIQADKIGPGLDSRADAAVFISMVYELPNWYHVSLYDNRNVNIAKSASVYQIQNRLYIGQFEELEHLKDGTLTKAIPCRRIFPFLDKIDELLFQWNDSRKLNTTDFSNCRLIFNLRYHPTNNNWNPFLNLLHKFFNYITVEWGIHVQDSERCPTGFQPLPVSSFLTDTVKQNIVNYTCSPTCINATDSCHEAKYAKFEKSGSEISSTLTNAEPQFHLTVNDQQHADFCFFETNFVYTTIFCDKYWEDIQPIVVPEYVKQLYPQFITVPMTYKEKDNHPYLVLDNKCNKLWAEEEKISF